MSIFKTLAKVVTGNGKGFLKETIDLVTGYLPNAEDKVKLKAQLQELENKREAQLTESLHVAATDLNDRVAQHEGTVKDLKSIPYLGPLMIFLRGSQRIAWGYGTLWMDNKWLFSVETFTDRQEIALIVINILVLGFLFGERAIKNVMPLFTKFMESKKS